VPPMKNAAGNTSTNASANFTTSIQPVPETDP
jgi:hypothetical protein